MSANIVIDTSAILAVLLDESEKQAVVERPMGSAVCAASLRCNTVLTRVTDHFFVAGKRRRA